MLIYCRYGFTNVVTPGDILMAYPSIWPFNQVFSDFYKNNTRSLPRPIDLQNLESSLKIDAVFVFNDPRDWALDSQVILDLLLSKNGVLGTYSDRNGDTSFPNNGWLQDGQPMIFFSNPDLFWATSYHLPRLGQGGFQASLEGLWEATTKGASLSKTIIGKPHAATYKFAEDVLQKHRVELLGGTGRVKSAVTKLDRVFMVGDNPESDIRGANEYESSDGTKWTSVLVKTGVFREGTQPAYKPDIIVENVVDAVKWGLRQEGWKKNIS
jgi:HAD superfamily hydrolase (TIGR01456 family)